MRRSAADRLRRLRWLLTFLFTALNAVGLIVFAWLLVANDSDQGDLRLSDDVARVTSVVKRLIQYDNGTLVTAFANTDEINQQCPQFAVLPGGSGQFPGYFSARRCVNVDPGALAPYARAAAQDGHTRSGLLPLGGGYVQLFVDPVRDKTGQYIGSVVAVADAEPTIAAHQRYVLFVVGGCVLLIGAVAAAGYFLAGRAIRPAVEALEQHDALLADAAHDLRNPIAALRALAETALANPAQSAELLPRTVRLASRMGATIDDLLVRARLAAGVDRLDAEPVWLHQLVTTLVEDTPAEGASLTVTAAPSLVHADAKLLTRAVGNLLNNALQHGKLPGRPAIVHVTVANGRVTVADHGPGVDSEFAGHVMERFRTGGSSSGLGLSIVKWVAQAHGGTLDIYNAEEGGAIFELVLPVASRP